MTVSRAKNYSENSLLSALAQRRFFWKQYMSFASGGFLPLMMLGMHMSLCHMMRELLL
ncbi:type IV secretion system, VirB6 family domain protein [Anaplasma phagocytophilum str. CRT53-1]|uniref:Type IV secretion system, VirB6 family domain protein n=1 Tax=Anaplasma phagocytophilum str. CRT53-1 TaxID=1359157 RepID=A0A0F3Q5L7_ANAPH|nr:type IV secretion system, VirB6 family domain protein [Anaplasma phagocytophilum str. CRT53-1]